jgi:hypothetical protein
VETPTAEDYFAVGAAEQYSNHADQTRKILPSKRSTEIHRSGKPASL